MTLGIRFSQGARQDLLETLSWYAQRDARVPPQVREAIDVALTLMTHQPEGGRPGPLNTRRLIVRGFPLSLVYRVTPTHIDVLALVAQRRAPNYWMKR